ncbi:helix-turn-helix domain-containing protein [Chryseobacterium aquifrigidense]|uniref:Helix-turn-helix protein n=1 Tax=Chryseobacterium aquifrigidense TaxID=558021 RepID=A0A543E9Y4_9FLAO|nr:helix-turn-helix transcriptional regulator [Chryseobacterium aquifrigidense]TQM18289.1 helix-turn-helix protein [Chryseobacterium aquifrigidense]
MDDKNKNNLISCYLKDFFKEKSISQKEIQESLNVSQQYVSSILNGKKSIGKKLAEKLFELYGVDKTILLTGEVPNIAKKELLGKNLDVPVEFVKLLQEQQIAFNAIQTIQDRKIEILTKNIESLKKELSELKSLINN